jgi:secreted trypsin-like serine protease
VRILFCTFLLLGSCTATNSAISPSGGKDARACTQGGVDSSEYMPGIVNGQKLKSGNSISSRLVTISLLKNGDSYICTGALLSGNIVLTAAHCLGDSLAETKILFSNNINCINKENSSELIRSVVDGKIHPAYSENISDHSHDIALLKFEGSLPSGFQFFSDPNEDSEIARSTHFILSGYGVTDYFNNDSGVLRITQIPVSHMLPEVDSNLIRLDQHKSGVCSGDSGGPLLVFSENRLKIIGVTVTVKGDTDLSMCKSESGFVKVKSHITWLNRSLNSLRQ